VVKNTKNHDGPRQKRPLRFLDIAKKLLELTDQKIPLGTATIVGLIYGIICERISNKSGKAGE
jgi:hypothetical protein